MTAAVAAQEESLERRLRRLGTCEEALEWAGTQSLAEAWATATRGDWLLWLAARVGVRRQDVVLAACACARLSLRHVPEGEGRPLAAIETAERWARGEAGGSLDDVRQAAREARRGAPPPTPTPPPPPTPQKPPGHASWPSARCWCGSASRCRLSRRRGRVWSPDGSSRAAAGQSGVGVEVGRVGEGVREA